MPPPQLTTLNPRNPTHQTPHPHTAFLSLKPPEPVLVFATSSEASRYQSLCKQGRILPQQNSTWVFVPMPAGLLRVRTASRGNVAFEFCGKGEARAFWEGVGRVGEVGRRCGQQPNAELIVYLGSKLLR